MIRHLFTACASLILATSLQAETLRLAVTTSFENAGLADVMLPAILADTGLDVQLLVVGTGQALRLGEAGDVDVVLVHAPAAEAAFVAAGHATHRTKIMYNDFVIVGPASDPTNARKSDSVMITLHGIVLTESAFVSRGDDSGTHQMEMMLWGQAGLDIGTFGSWYRSVGAGMGAALNTASGLNAHVLSDRATWLNFANKGDLALLFEGDPLLFNQYSFLPIDADRHPHVQADAVARLEAWLVSPAAQQIIDGYRIQGEQVFTFNAVAQ